MDAEEKTNVLDLVDHTIFSLERAAGTTSLIQCVWVYDRPVDIAGLRRFHHHLQRGRLARRIEVSPLPFGRYRWVSPGGHSGLEVVATPRPRAAFDGWLAEQAEAALDAEHGPGWHLAVLPFTDGGTGISLVVSHCLTDAVGLCEAVADAASGVATTLNWPPAQSRTRWRAIREDAGQTLRDVPGIARAAAAAARLVRGGSGAAEQADAPVAPAAEVDEPVTVPSATVFVDAADWDARAAELGGTSNTLLAAVAARLAQRVGRVAADGSVTLTMPISRRCAGDTRANAITNVDIVVDPAPAATDLRPIRTATKRALTRSADQPDERWTLLPLIPLTPERLRRQWVGAATNSAASVGASNVGLVAAAVNRPDGTDADHFAMRSLQSGMTTAMLHRQGGVLSVLSGRAGDRVFISVVGYQPQQPGSDESLQQHISDTLRDFTLMPTAGWHRAPAAAQNAHNRGNRD
ncbi:hypothetical protein [Mycolicibacterium arseniciresistens]|uniref:Fatty acyl-AMP ligase FadD28 and polyketide synthase n=1 Tax=Mycolicibacterium arseniciresistens TaxID=3062257 RepID=A0ABT8UIF1_9MYCO|nr:hypothetical protein [Mycolicibacterium arseniciresistens]MDO3637553.1 hypothetical protein [Mycolicibacterium arseniciresistens]